MKSLAAASSVGSSGHWCPLRLPGQAIISPDRAMFGRDNNTPLAEISTPAQARPGLCLRRSGSRPRVMVTSSLLTIHQPDE
ncbi:hypothetical protein NITHO_3190003 [Nitrolancea hollandica Lb]|uniref:Uncharacterized protein n=1 Tax=Nitrolancea hollandica Lb TaxID=1129897 RepID=I4EHM8_9BACT|nr:hypothetical protein NITHO_3190003 [Nitrolancea hollandica Lb]